MQTQGGAKCLVGGTRTSICPGELLGIPASPRPPTPATRPNPLCSSETPPPPVRSREHPPSPVRSREHPPSPRALT